MTSLQEEDDVNFPQSGKGYVTKDGRQFSNAYQQLIKVQLMLEPFVHLQETEKSAENNQNSCRQW